jgi:ATP-binding cassette subfamily B protein
MSNFNDDKTESSFNGNALFRLLTYTKPHLHWFGISLVLVMILTGTELLRPIFIGDAINLFKEKGQPSELTATVIKYGIVLVIGVICDLWQGWILQKTGQKIIFGIRKEIYLHIQSLSSRFFDLTPVGKLVTRVTNDVDALEEMYSGILVKLFRNIVYIIGLAVIMLTLDYKLALFSFVLLPFVVLLTGLLRYFSRKAFRVSRARLTDLNTFLSENITGMKIIQIFGREERKYEEFDDKSKRFLKASFNEIMVYATFRPLIYISSILSLMIVLSIGGREVLSETISVGTLYIFAQYIQSFFDPIQELAEHFATLQSSLASAEKIFTILDEEAKIPEKENPVELKDLKGKIEFSHVWFAYDDENYVLRDVSFIIEPGQKIAFVGATGAGKTSILNLIGRYYDVQKGNIYIDDVDIRDLKKSDLRRFIGQMQQDVLIFEGTIKSNIRLYDDYITDEEIETAAKHVNASHFIEKLPRKYDEPVSERGATFSTGEKQLLSFARTLAHKPGILVLDEATANIDTETEILIQDALEKLMKDRTTIMVAHRLSTIQHADKIYVISKGRIIESGNHFELLDKKGAYYELYKLQYEA